MIFLQTILFLALYTGMVALAVRGGAVNGLWNRVDDFKTAYLQALLFLEVSNWYDGIVIDRLWVGHSKFWIIAGTEDIPFVKPWKEILLKRIIASLVWLAGAAVVALLVVLIF